MGTVRTALQVSSTLGALALVFGLPWLLAGATGVSTRIASMEPAALVEREAVPVWVPPVEDEPPVEEASRDEASAEEEPVAEEELLAADAEPPSEASPEPEPAEPEPPSTEASPSEAPARKMAALKVAPGVTVAVRGERVAAVSRTRKAQRTTRTRPELTRKQKRRRARLKRRRERLARQPQCHELVDEVVPVRDGEWYVGRELANCYRAHPRQFARMGGLRWVEGDDGRREGLEILLSRHARGDLARSIGIQRGDVLRSLNGVPLRSKAGSGFALVQLLGSKARFTFVRDGEEHRVRLRVVGDRKLERARQAAAERARAEEAERERQEALERAKQELREPSDEPVPDGAGDAAAAVSGESGPPS